MQQVVPALRVRFYEARRIFFEKVGFVEQWKHQFEPTFPVFASIAWGDMELFLTEHAADCQFGGLVHFYASNVDLCYTPFRAHGVPVSEPPSNSIGPEARDLLVVDPHGNRLSFITHSAESTQ